MSNPLHDEANRLAVLLQELDGIRTRVLALYPDPVRVPYTRTMYLKRLLANADADLRRLHTAITNDGNSLERVNNYGSKA